MTTTWTCPNGHVETMKEDLGDPADREQVMRVEEEIRFGGCRTVIDPNPPPLGSGCRGLQCGQPAKRTSKTETRYI